MAKVSKRVKKEETKMQLTADEHRILEVTPLEMQNAKLSCAVEEQNLQNLILEYKLLETKIEKQKQVVSLAHQKYALSKQKYNSVVDEVMKAHNIDSVQKFGFNEKGEIILPQQG